MRRAVASVVLSAVICAVASAQTTVFTWPYSSATSGFALAIAGPGDLNGDAIPDAVVGTWGLDYCVTARSGYDGGVLWQVCEPNWMVQFAKSLAGAGDVDLDGRPDVVVAALGAYSTPGFTRILSGATGGVIRTIPVAALMVDGGRDFDGDGIPDQLGTYSVASGPGGAGVHVFSGATGAIIFTQDNTWCSCPVKAGFIDDVNADGFDDLVVSFIAPMQTMNGAVAVLTGPNGAFHSVITPSSVNEIIGATISDLGDLTGDGQPELGITGGPSSGGDSFRLRVFNLGSGGTIPWSASLWQLYPGGAISNAVRIADRTGDGVADVAIKNMVVPLPNSTVGFLHVLSGATGMPFSSSPSNLYGTIAAAGDLNADSATEVISASYVVTTLQNPVYSGSVLVQSSATLPAPATNGLGGGCGSTPPPSLGATLLRIGQPWTLTLQGAAPSLPADFVLDVSPPAPFTSGGCTFHPDLAHMATWIVIPGATGATGTFVTAIPVPSIPTAAGAVVTAQAIVYGTTAPNGFDLSNGLLAIAGF
jgi:hypothetical protein